MPDDELKQLSGMLDELEGMLVGANPEVLEKWSMVRAAFSALPADQTSAAMSELIDVFRKRLQSCVEAVKSTPPATESAGA